MNLPVQTKVSLPAHLAHFAGKAGLMAMNNSAAAGISSGGWPRISIKAARFRLQHPQGEEVVVNALDLDVIIVDANPHNLQKIYYTGKYDPGAEASAPDCFSDNGIGPSTRANKPQSGVCATCPHNVWGSIVLPSGAKSRACGDYKKVAVLIANNPEGPVFELRIPAGSLGNWAKYVDSLNKRGVPVGTMVTKLRFDAAADYPKLVFEPFSYIDENQAAVVMEVFGTEEVDQCTGKNDAAIDPATFKPTQTVGLATPVNPPLPERGPLPPVMAPQVAVPLPPAGMPPVPVAAPTGIAPVSAGADTPTAAPAVTRSSRRKKTETAGEAIQAQPSAVQSEVPAFVRNAPGAVPVQTGFVLPPVVNAAQVAAPLVPTGVTNASLDDLITKAMNA